MHVVYTALAVAVCIAVLVSGVSAQGPGAGAWSAKRPSAPRRPEGPQVATSRCAGFTSKSEWWQKGNRRLGVGGMAEVWLGTCRNPACQGVVGNAQGEVVLKITTPKFKPQEACAEATLTKAMAAKCPNSVMKVFDIFPTPGSAGSTSIVAEVMKGGDLAAPKPAEIAAKPARFRDQKQLIAVWQQMVMAVACVHRSGYLHRDVKAENFLLSGDGKTVKLADFGVSMSLADYQKQKAASSPQRPLIMSLPAHQTPRYSCTTAPYTADGKLGDTRVESWIQRMLYDARGLGWALWEVTYNLPFHLYVHQCPGYGESEMQAEELHGQKFGDWLAAKPNGLELFSQWNAAVSRTGRAPMPTPPMLKLMFDLITFKQNVQDVNTRTGLFQGVVPPVPARAGAVAGAVAGAGAAPAAGASARAGANAGAPRAGAGAPRAGAGVPRAGAPRAGARPGGPNGSRQPQRPGARP